MSIAFSRRGSSMYEPITDIGMYSDSTPMVKTAGWNRIVKQADTMTVTGGSMAEFVNAMFLHDAIIREDGMVNRLVLPYVPGARQDRSNPTGDVLNTAWSVGNMIRERFRFGDVVILDPHSPVVVKAMGPSPIIYPLAGVAKMLPSIYDGVIAADKGGKARAEEMASALGVPVFYGGKTRDVSTGKLTGFTLEPLSPAFKRGFSKDSLGHYLVADDICDGGGTFNGLAAKIAEQGATADLYVSHGIFSKGTDSLLENYGKIYTTDSLEINERNKVTILPLVEKMRNYNG